MTDLHDTFDERWQGILRANILRLQQERFKTGQAAARAAGINPSTYRVVLGGHNNVTTSFISRVVAGWGVRPDQVFGTASAPTPSTTTIQEGGLIRATELPLSAAEATHSIPELGVEAGDLLIFEAFTKQALVVDDIVAVKEGEDIRLYLVRSIDPTILARSGGPAVVLHDRYHEVVAIMAELRRRRRSRS